jgi:hypothetical protein
MKKNISPYMKTLLTLWFIAGVWISGYIAITFRDTQAVRIATAVTASLLYWTGYGRWHNIVFKNTTFNRPTESLKGFSFFLLFLGIYLVVFAGYFTFNK